MSRRIKFYSANDMSSGFELRNAETILNSFQKDIVYTDINDIIELYNISLFFKANIYLKDWGEDIRQQYDKVVGEFQPIIARFFSLIDDRKIVNDFSSVDVYYRESFWTLFDRYKLFHRIDKNVFAEIIQLEICSIRQVLRFSGIVNQYGEVIADYLKSQSDSAELLMDYYWADSVFGKEKLYFPDQLTMQARESLIERYVEQSDHLNYLQLIAGSHDRKNELCVSDKIRLRAKHKCEQLTEEYFQHHVGLKMGVEVKFTANQSEDYIFSIEEGIARISYSTDFILENLDYPTILNNFIYFFEFVDFQYRCLFVHKQNQLSIFEKTLGVHVRDEYFEGIAFQQIQVIGLLQIVGYYDMLLRQGIRLESVLEWFYTEDLSTEFSIPNFQLQLAGEQASYRDKCRIICSEIESILKQYKSLVEDGKIDHELIGMNSIPLAVKDVPSLITDKYAYFTESVERKTITFLMFSNQSLLTYLGDGEEYKNLYDILARRKVKKNDFPECSREGIDWLINHDILIDDEQDNLSPRSADLLNLLYDLYENDVVLESYWRKSHGEDFQLAVEKNWIQTESSLLSKPEQDYFNYIMNRKEFGNSLDLRNKYLHGTQGYDESIHQQNYYMLLKMLVFLTIKINNELCSYSSIQNEKGSMRT